MTSVSRNYLRRLIAEILGEIVGEVGLNLTEATQPDDVPFWDSHNHVRLMLDLADTLHVRFTSKDIASPTNVGGLIDLLVAKIES